LSERLRIGRSYERDKTFSLRIEGNCDAASEDRVVGLTPLHLDLSFNVSANSQEHHVAWIRDRCRVLRLVLHLLPDIVLGERCQQSIGMRHLNDRQAGCRQQLDGDPFVGVQIRLGIRI
jgi:hypothetical protein